MTHIEGDGINEDLYYLLWRKDSPFNEKLNIKIPDTIVFRKGRPMSWYFTNNEGVVLRKKQSSLTFPEITKKFTRKATEGDIVAYFINIDEEKKLSRLLDKTQIRGMEQDGKEDKEELPKHEVDYYGLKEFISTFSDYKNFENKTGILQRFISPYGSNNELIQAIWSPRVCVFTKRVNLRRLNETRFDVYERALTFDGPDFYSKNVPLRGGYIPGKLRATCDMIVRHIAYISYEKISIKRIVGYFKVDRDENVWFLWTSSIRINETSKTHKKMSQYVDKPLCLEPCIQTNENVRLIKSNFAAKPASLQMNEQCTICAKKVDKVSTISVSYKLLLGNEDILKRSEQRSDGRVKVFMNGQDPENTATQQLPVSVRKGAIGVPAFIKRLHPGLTFKEFQVLREKDHFLMLKTDVCEECYLLVSKQFEGGFPYKLTEPKKRLFSAQTLGSIRPHNLSTRLETASSKARADSYVKLPSATNKDEDGDGDSNDEIDEGDRDAAIFVTDNNEAKFFNRTATAGHSHRNKMKMISTEAEYFPVGVKSYTSTVQGLSTAHSNRSGHLPLFLNGQTWIKNAQKMIKTDQSTFESHLEETKMDSLHGDPSMLRRNVMKALRAETESSFRLRSVQSVKGLNSIDEGTNKQAVKPSRPHTTFMKSNIKSGRSLKAKEKAQTQKDANKYKIPEPGDLFEDSDDENNSEFENVLEMKSTLQRERSAKNSGRVDLAAKTSKLFSNRTTTEEKLQDHLDQDMVLVMENASQDKNSVYFADFNPPKKKNKKSNSIIKLKEHLAQNAKQPEMTTVRSSTAIGGYRGRFKRPSIDGINEKKIGKELEEQVNNLVNQYCEENDYKL